MDQERGWEEAAEVAAEGSHPQRSLHLSNTTTSTHDKSNKMSSVEAALAAIESQAAGKKFLVY
jgi:hypothetical protein